MMTRPILYSFRRCPYAMRARLALASSGTTCVLREVVLRDKPAEMLTASPKGTVPVLVLGEEVIEESLEIIDWALTRSDPEGWLSMPPEGRALIDTFDGPFKTALDRYKYSTRYTGADKLAEREAATEIALQLEPRLAVEKWLFGSTPVLADMAILPFIRQFANTDRTWFDAQPWPHLSAWLKRFETSDRFGSIMQKYPQWAPGQTPIHFP